ncbi:unnamed protein product, partial [Closterium sp. NIES-54]
MAVGSGFAAPIRNTTRNVAGNGASENARSKSGPVNGTAGSTVTESRVVGSAGPEAQLGSAAAVGSNGVAGGRRRRKTQPSSDTLSNAESGAGRGTSIESANNGRRGSTASDVNRRLTSNAASQPLDDSVTASQPLDVSDPRVWLPPPPDVPRPRATHNAAMLAYIGDGVYELFARRHFLNPPSAIATYCQRVTAVVCCEAQTFAALLSSLHSSLTVLFTCSVIAELCNPTRHAAGMWCGGEAMLPQVLGRPRGGLDPLCMPTPLRLKH